MSSAAPSAALKETNSSSSSRRSRRRSRPRSHALLNVKAVIGTHRNRTTATSFTRNRRLIQVSFALKRPPQPSTLFVASDDLNPFYAPVILCSVDDLLLLRVNVGSTADQHLLTHYCDYFVYRAYPTRSWLRLLERPPPPGFHTDRVGLLPRPDGEYTVAALMEIGSDDVYELQLYHSETSTWTATKLAVQGRPWDWDPARKRIPMHCGALLRHRTSAVVTIGGEGGTVAWVDLWRSILLCDVLSPTPSLRAMPVPLPETQMSLNDGMGVRLDFGGHSRGISYNRDKGCLVLVHLEREEFPHPIHATLDAEKRKVLDWEVTTWSNSKMTDSLEDWHQEHNVRASKITVDDTAQIQEGASGSSLLLRQRELRTLSMCQPTLSPNGGDDVVYLVAREKYLHPEAWLVAVDMKENEGALKRVAYIGNRDHHYCHGLYCLSRISKYTNPDPKTRALKSSPTTDPVSKDEETVKKPVEWKKCNFGLKYDSWMKIQEGLNC